MRFNIISVDEYGLVKLDMAGILKELNVNILNVRDEMDVITLLNDKKHEINAIIWAFNSVDSDCFTAIKKLKSKEPHKRIPVIIVSRFTDKKYIIKAIESGAGEYIAQPYDEKTIRKKMCRILGIPFENIVVPAIDDDIITFNFSEMCSREIKSASRGNHTLSIMLVTVVHKDNTQVGARDADGLIRILNQALKTKLRETDTCFRYGDESLIILLPFADNSGARVVEGKIYECFNTHSVIKQKNAGFCLISAFVSFPEDGRVRDKLLEKLESRYSEINI